MDLLNPKLLIGGTAASIVIFLIAAYCTRASLRRSLVALLAGSALIPLVLVYDRIAAANGLWSYPALANHATPLLLYVANAFYYGGALGLVGWRIVRRWGTRGLVAFVLLFGLFGVTRDYAYSITSGMIAFGTGPLPLVADFLAYSSGGLLVQLLMRLIMGPAISDPLRTAHSSRPVPGTQV